MDEPEMNGRTFMQVICEKYSPENFPYRRGPGMGVVVPSGPQGSPMKDRLNLPSILVLNGCGISHAGDEGEIAAFCAHVVELDLSHNRLHDWREISKIVMNIPNLDFLNLSSNPLSEAALDSECAEAFSKVRRLVLNSTHVTWDVVNTFMRELTDLEELFLCLNEYSTVIASAAPPCPSLRLLHITDNNLHDWNEVRKFGTMYPSLDTLVLANNYLSAILDSEDLRRLFPNLRSINLHNSGLSRWEDIENLNFLPKLKEVRLQGIPLLQDYSTTERRSLMIAQLPSVNSLNGSVITEGEREDAERFFIRYYLDHSEKELPHRYHSLVTKYGKLAPLAEIDLRPRCHATVDVHFDDRVQQVNIRLDQTVAELKKQLKEVVRLSASNMRLYYIDKDISAAFGPEEMKYSTRALHSYSIQDGDEILVVPKTK